MSKESKALHELIEASEPKIFRWHQVNREQFSATPIGCDYVPRASYDRIKQIAELLALSLETYNNSYGLPVILEETLARCRGILEGK